MSRIYRIKLAGGPRDGQSYDSVFPIEAGEVFLSKAGSIIEGDGGSYVALGEPEVGIDGKLETVAYWEPNRPRRRATSGDILAAGLAGIGIGCSIAITVYLLIGLGWVAETLTALLGGAPELVLYSILTGFTLTIGWALIDPTITEKRNK
jgi:hypothetical protein